MLQSHRVNELNGLLVPNGLRLKLVLSQRAYRLADDTVVVVDRPNYPVIARIHAIFTESSIGAKGSRDV